MVIFFKLLPNLQNITHLDANIPILWASTIDILRPETCQGTNNPTYVDTGSGKVSYLNAIWCDVKHETQSWSCCGPAEFGQVASKMARLLARFMYGSAGMKKHHSDRGPLPSRRAYVSLHQHVDCMWWLYGRVCYMMSHFGQDHKKSMQAGIPRKKHSERSS